MTSWSDLDPVFRVNLKKATPLLHPHKQGISDGNCLTLLVFCRLSLTIMKQRGEAVLIKTATILSPIKKSKLYSWEEVSCMAYVSFESGFLFQRRQDLISSQLEFPHSRIEVFLPHLKVQSDKAILLYSHRQTIFLSQPAPRSLFYIKYKGQ